MYNIYNISMAFYNHLDYCIMEDNLCINSYINQIDLSYYINYLWLLVYNEDFETVKKLGWLVEGELTYLVLRFKRKYKRHNKIIIVSDYNINKYIDDISLIYFCSYNKYDDKDIYKMLKI